MQKIIFVSHCILNTASKVIMFNKEEMEKEEMIRKIFLNKAIQNNIQIIQLPCPEFLMYGANRWGHVSNQFNNVFFKNHCRKILFPIIEQLKEYISLNDRFEILGILGIDGSPSCGVDYTCTGDWNGSFENRLDILETLSSCQLERKPGIFMEVFKEMLIEENLDSKISLTGLSYLEPEKCLSLIE